MFMEMDYLEIGAFVLSYMFIGMPVGAMGYAIAMLRDKADKEILRRIRQAKNANVVEKEVEC